MKTYAKACRAKNVGDSYGSVSFRLLFSPFILRMRLLARGGKQVLPFPAYIAVCLGFFFHEVLTWHFNLSKPHQEQRWDFFQMPVSCTNASVFLNDTAFRDSFLPPSPKSLHSIFVARGSIQVCMVKRRSKSHMMSYILLGSCSWAHFITWF